MDESHLRTLRKHLEDYLKNEKKKITEKNSIISSICAAYQNLGESVANQKYEHVYPVSELSKHIFRAALMEVEENDAKFAKETSKENNSGIQKGYRTSLYHLSIDHLKRCSKNNIDNNTAHWLNFSLRVLEKQWIQSNLNLENEISSCIWSCCAGTQLHWVQHGLIKKLWTHIWTRIGTKSLDSTILSNYVNTAVIILESVDLSVVEKSPYHLAKTVIMSLKKGTETEDHQTFWTHSRKFSYASVLSFIVQRYGIEARDLLLNNILDIISILGSLITVEKSATQDSKEMTMMLIDDVIKLAMIEKVGNHRITSEKVVLKMKDLIQTSIEAALKSAHSFFFKKQVFTIPDQYITYISRWILAGRQLNIPFIQEASPSSNNSSRKSSNFIVFTYESLVSLSFGETITPTANKCNAWNGCMKILTEVIKSRKMTTTEIESIVVSLWKKRKTFASDVLRSNFCLLLASAISESLNFGADEIPSIDSIFKYAVSLMPNLTSLPSSSQLIHSIIIHRSRDVSNDLLSLVFDTISRTSPSSSDVIRLVAAIISHTDYNENSRFCSIANGEKRHWGLRKDIVDWLLATPNVMTHKLLYQLCKYHPVYCYNDDTITESHDDQLHKSLIQCQLMSGDKQSVISSVAPLDSTFDNLIDYITESLDLILDCELSFDAYILAYEFNKAVTCDGFTKKIDYQALNSCIEMMDEKDILSKMKFMSCWPQKLEYPVKFNSPETLAAYMEVLLDDKTATFDDFLPMKEELLPVLLETSKRSKTRLMRIKNSISFNNYLKKYVFENVNDIYDTTKRFSKYSIMFSDRNILAARNFINKTAEEQIGSSIEESDYDLIEDIIDSTYIKSIIGNDLFGGYDIDPYVVAKHPENVFFDDRNVICLLKRLKNSPFIAQNIVRHIIKNQDYSHLHIKTLKYLMKEEKLLVVCLATIPNLWQVLKLYQVNFDPTSPTAHVLNLDLQSIQVCQNYISNPKTAGKLVKTDDLKVLFGSHERNWYRMCYQFWKHFKKEPSFVCESLHQFARESVSIGLSKRLLRLLYCLANNEFSKPHLKNPHLQYTFRLVYRSIIYLMLENDPKDLMGMIHLCWDNSLKCDLIKHRKPQYAVSSNQISRFETQIALKVEKFLQKGVENDDVDYTIFGYVEFYKQLNENLSEELIKMNALRGFYIVDVLASIWNIVPDLRCHILPIIARFKYISTAWSRFPQPPHIVIDDKTFLYKLRFKTSMRIISPRKFDEREMASTISILLTTFNNPCFKYEIELFRERMRKRRRDRRNVLCILSSLLSTTAYCEDIDKEVYRAIMGRSVCFKELSSYVIPFLFYLIVRVHEKYEYAAGKLFSCLSECDIEDKSVAYCLAESVDSVGLDILTMFEKSKDHDVSAVFAVSRFFDLSRLFIKHGYLTHAFTIANIIFDRITRSNRNMMMINRTHLSDIPSTDQLIDLLVDIYVAENNSVALASLPPNVQIKPAVRRVMYKKAKEWVKLVSNNLLDDKDSTVIRWMCGLQADDKDKYLDSILRCRLLDYPKLITTPSKFVYFILFHLGVRDDTSSAFDRILSETISSMSIDDIRMIMLANGDHSFQPESIEEHVICAFRDIRETKRKRKEDDNETMRVENVNIKTTRIMKVAEILIENKAYDAATLILNQWRKECEAWPSSNVDIDLVEISQNGMMCQAGDIRMAETNLRAMYHRLDTMTDVAVAEYTLVLSKITIEYRYNLNEGIRILEKGCKKLEKCESPETKLKVLLNFHSICVEQLSKLEEYKESRSFRMKEEAISAFTQQLNKQPSMRMKTSTDEESKRAVQRISREQQCEKDDVERVKQSIKNAARRAIVSAFDALETVAHIDDDDEAIRTASLIIFPLIDLIYKYETDPEVVNYVKLYVTSQFSSSLWICATSHIASKCFSTESTPLKRVLFGMLCRLIIDYPYHVLHTLLMYEYEQNGAEVRRMIDMATDKKTSRDMGRLKEIVKEMRAAHDAYRELSRLEVKGNTSLEKVNIDGKSCYKVPKNLKILKCRLEKVPIPIISQKIGEPGDYSLNGLITWKDYKPVFTIADGLSAPKIWEIQGSNGVWYRTVWKKDDVRQDVLVEQMFDVTNNMLGKKVLRTYNVVPIDTECGIIEFCGGTISLKELLCGANREKGLHNQIYPNEPTAAQVSVRMRECQRESAEKRRNVFEEICRNVSPVFRHFFYSKFSSSLIWREKVDSYRNSLANWSVVCYIVGLGDRHASNILFDQEMCTFVHIDLGMILEYSKRSLPVPEQVPFRISRDLLDPILIEGIENGQLADICTDTMEKLKKNGKVLLGVASALLRETMSNFRETEMAAGRPSYISEMAIGRLRDKLEGTDDGVTAQSSNLQVRRLLRDATNADNLSRMFCGWMPFL